MLRRAVVALLVLLLSVPIVANFASAFPSGNDHANFDFSMLKPGDIIFCYDSTFDLFIPGHWTHVAIFVGYDDNGQGWIIESGAPPYLPKYGVQYSKLETLNRYDEIAIGRVNVSEYIVEKALEWIEGKVGDGFDFWWIFKEVNNGEFYCSELVWAGFYVQGIDLDSHPGFSWKYLWGVAPQEIYDSSHVIVVSVQEA